MFVDSFVGTHLLYIELGPGSCHGFESCLTFTGNSYHEGGI